MQGHRTLVRPYPISIEWPVHWVRDSARADECRAKCGAIRTEAEMRSSASASIAWTTPRASRSAFWPSSAARMAPGVIAAGFTFAQFAAPSRTKLERYQELNDTRGARSPDASTQRFGSDG